MYKHIYAYRVCVCVCVFGYLKALLKKVTRHGSNVQLWYGKLKYGWRTYMHWVLSHLPWATGNWSHALDSG